MSAKKQQFRLSSLLRLRESARDERRLELAETQRKYAEVQNELAAINTKRQEMLGLVRLEVTPGDVSLTRLLDTQRYAATLQTRETNLLERRRLLNQEIEQRRQALIEADKEVRMLQKLQEHHIETCRHEQFQLETNNLDEIALNKTNRPSDH